MNMRIFLLAGLALGLSVAANAEVPPEKPSAKTLIDSVLEAIDSHHVLVTRVSIPANIELPMHFHPSEEFLYVIEGETILRITGQPDQLIKAGMATEIPARAVHTAITKDMASEVIVFRVHPNGQPVRMAPTEK